MGTVNEDFNLYRDIKIRTGGEIHIGVVGPVRTGKSTFIKKFMDLLVIPSIENEYARTRVIDQLPQSGDGKTITTTEPKFVPEEGADINLLNGLSMSIRMIDCVGYLIPGVLGHIEDGKSRMVKTPWSDEKIPFEKAADIGTEKVIKNHSTVGIVVTCDGTFGDIERDDYVQAEELAIKQLKDIGKPFVIVLNTSDVLSPKTKKLALDLKKKYSKPVLAINAATMNEENISDIFSALLKEFPIEEISINLPDYLDALPGEHWIKKELIDLIKNWMKSVITFEDLENSMDILNQSESVDSVKVSNIEMSTGCAVIDFKLKEGLYYKIIEELMNHTVSSDKELFLLLSEYSKAKEAYDHFSGAIDNACNSGYGIVHPKLNQMEIGQPQVFRHGNKYGVRLIAKAPCMHIINTEITTEVSPVVGSQQQSEDLAKYLRMKFEENDNQIWDTNLFGKTLEELVVEQINGKLAAMPDSLQGKIRRSLQKISDEGKDYFICIIL